MHGTTNIKYIIATESGQQGCMLIAEVRVETRNVFGFFSCESLLLHGVEIFMFVVLCIEYNRII